MSPIFLTRLLVPVVLYLPPKAGLFLSGWATELFHQFEQEMVLVGKLFGFPEAQHFPHLTIKGAESLRGHTRRIRDFDVEGMPEGTAKL